MTQHQINRFIKIACASALLATGWHTSASAQMCPQMGWQENLVNYQKSTSTFPTEDTANLPTPDCNFHQWSAEAFVWATALDAKGVPRFLNLPTVDQLLPAVKRAKSAAAHVSPPSILRLGMRTFSKSGPITGREAAGAIVEADGSVLVGPNGYPVYASVHMNQPYFETAKANMIKTGDYQKNASKDSYFPVGSAVFKATWLRLDAGQAAPAGAFVTKAEVPELVVRATKQKQTIAASSKTVQVDVALVGLHVVGYTVNHPEFLWATFEHNQNAPRVADNSFNVNGSSPQGYTFYKAHTPYSVVNVYQPQSSQSFNRFVPQLSFNLQTQKFAPIANAVLLNATGGEDQQSENGVQNVINVNQSLATFFKSSTQSPAQALFGNYLLNGTVWLAPNSYVTTNPNLSKLDSSNAIDSVNLANTTAETFQQVPLNKPLSGVQNCFMCHNAQAPSSNLPNAPTLQSRRIAISHVLGYGTPYAVPNLVVLPLKSSKTATSAK